MITHNDSAAIASSVAIVAMLWDPLHAPSPPPSEWYAQRFLDVCRQVETDGEYSPRSGEQIAWSGRLSARVHEQVTASREQNLTVLEPQDRWHSGAYPPETVPTVL
jgi:hypothetical protein